MAWPLDRAIENEYNWLEWTIKENINRGKEMAKKPVITFETMPKLLTPKMVQELLHISSTTFFRWVTKGKLPGAFKLGRLWRVDRDRLKAWIDEQIEQGSDGKDKRVKDTSKVELIT